MAVKIQKPRGTMDIFPSEARLWQKIESTARTVAARYGFGEVRTPTFEELSLFKRGVGEVTDVVQKEMYTFTDREDDEEEIEAVEGEAVAQETQTEGAPEAQSEAPKAE